MMTDFKIIRHVSHGNGCAGTCIVQFYEGEITTKNEETGPVTRYRRTKMIGEKKVVCPAGTTLRDLVADMKKELQKDKKRVPLPEQS